MTEPVDKLLSGFIEDTDDKALVIDLSPFVSGDAAKEIKWASPLVPDLYKVGADALAVQKRFAGMPDEMAVEIALMGACHAAANGAFQTGETPPMIFYAALAMSKKHGRLWMYLSRSLREFVPEAWAFITGNGSAETLKKILFSSLDSASNTPANTPEN